MTLLSDEELATIREAIDFPALDRGAARHDVRSYTLLRDGAEVDTGPAAAAINDRAPEIVEMMETVLTTKTRRPSVVSAGAARGASLAELAELVPQPVACVWASPTGEAAAFVLLETVATHQLIASLMGLGGGDEPAPKTEKLGLLDKKVTARVFRAFGRAVAEVGVRVGDDVRVDTDWRRLTLELGQTDLVVLPLEIEEPVTCKMDIVIVAARASSKTGEMPTFADHLPDIEVDITAELGHTELTLSELLELKAGMILPLGTAENAPLSVLLQGVPRYRAKVQLVGGRICLNLV